MAEQIYTIPINEAFEKKHGCPLCALAQDLERSSLDYIMGAAMMEPDVRIQTNRLGFCRPHYDKMLAMKNRLSLALMLESRLAVVEDALVPPDIKTGRFSKLKKNSDDISGDAILATSQTCFVCSRAGEFEKQYMSNLVHMYKKDPAFRQKLLDQEFFCLEHYGKLLQYGKADLSEAAYAQFAADLHQVEIKYIQNLSQAVTGFCRSFDHQNAGKALMPNQVSSVDDAIDFLAGK